MENQKENLTETKTKNDSNKSKLIKKPKFNIKKVKKSFQMPQQPENYKQIYQVYDTGKRELIDYSGIKQECDIFGFPVKKYHNNISGISNYDLRLSKELIKEIKYTNKNLYIPITAKFEGASMFPRPLSLPFVNQEINPIKLIKEIKKEKRISALRNKIILSLNEPLKDKDAIPSFICQKIAENNPNDKKHIMNLIDKYINKKKKEHKYELDFEIKNKEIKALKGYKKNLSDNLGNKLYNGKNISESGQEDIKEKYETIRKLIYNQAYKSKNEKNNTLINFSRFKKLNVLKRVGTMNNLYQNSEMLIKNKSCTNIFGKNRFEFLNKEKDLPIQKEEINKSMIKTHSIFAKFNKNKRNENSIKASSSQISFLNKNKKENVALKTSKSCFFVKDYKGNINLKYDINLYTPESRLYISENKNKTAINFFTNSDTSKKGENTKTNQNKSTDNISFISDDKKIQYNLKNTYNYKTLKALRSISDKEKELLKGFQTPIEEDKMTLKHISLDLKEQALENYKRDMKILEIVNKLHFEKEKRENLFKDKILKKKIEGKKIFEKNFRKIHFK